MVGEPPMLDEAIKAKLRDPAYLDLHLAAARAIRKVGQAGWYDSHFFRRYEVARFYLSDVNPAALSMFEAGFAALKAPPDFQPIMLADLFDDATRERIGEVIKGMQHESSDAQSLWEKQKFGRRVIWDHPFFLQLQRDLMSVVSNLVGCDLTLGYNFLSLYSGEGICGVHMDQPISMYTLDYCIDQGEEWPIHFSRIVDWPTYDDIKGFDPARLKADPDLAFRPYVLKPNQALIFNGSSQWHYRDAIVPGSFCHLLFFHYFPAGCERLVDPLLWAEHFDLPQLKPLADLFAREDLLSPD
jgi:hypothetical protein